MKYFYVLMIVLLYSGMSLTGQNTFGPDQWVCADGSPINIPCVGDGNWSNYQLIESGDGFFDGYAPFMCPWSMDYYPGPGDVESGYVNFCLILYGSWGNITFYDCITFFLIEPPFAYAGENVSICQDESYQLVNSYATSYGELLWWSYGDGIFDDPSIVNPTYTPGVNDINAGSVELELIAYPLDVCDYGYAESMTISIFERPYAILPTNDSLDCEFYNFQNEEWMPIPLEFEAGAFNAVAWTTSGDGYFYNPSAIPTDYMLGNDDLMAGEVTLSVQLINECATSIFETTIFIPQQLINIETDGFVGISSFLDLSAIPVSEVLEPIEACVAMISNQNGQSYIPHLSYQLGNWMPEGYKIKMNCPGCLALFGEPIQNRTFTISGSQVFLPVLCESPVDIEELFAGHLNSIILIYDWGTGEMYIPDPGVPPTLTTLLPGKAYSLVTSNFGLPFDIEFPGGNNANTSQEMLLRQGWSGVSLCLSPESPSVEDIFDELGDNLVIMYSNEGVWFPQEGINTLGPWNRNTSYVIKVENDQNLSISGSPLTDKTVSLQSGWSYLPVLTSTPVSCMQLFSSVMDDLIIVKEIAGTKVFWPARDINTLDSLQPGSGYLIKTSGNINISFP